jgi:Flp pilus assembly protein TadG
MSGDKPLWRSAEEGAAAVEAGVIMSVLLLLVVGSVELGRAFWVYNTMLVAVEEAGRAAMMYNHGAPLACNAQSQASYCPAPSNTPLANCTASRARQILSAYQAPNIAVSVKEDATSSPTKVTVCASYSFNFIAPRLLPYGPLNLTSQLTVPLL